MLRDEDALVGTLGLDSLDLAVLVVGLEQALGVDPFRQGARPVTSFGELVKLYEGVLSGDGPSRDDRSAASGREQGA
jgi:acyl carrier protein